MISNNNRKNDIKLNYETMNYILPILYTADYI